MKKTWPNQEGGIEHPVIKPDPPLYRPTHYPVNRIPTGIIIETQSDCSQYIDMLYEKDAYIEELLTELAILRNKEQQRLSEKLKKEHEAELRKFENRKKRKHRKNRIIMKEKPSSQISE